jgi:hypothetical protein
MQSLSLTHGVHVAGDEGPFEDAPPSSSLNPILEEQPDRTAIARMKARIARIDVEVGQF